MIAAFLDDLEKSRGITARSRNLRLTAIRSFFHYAAYEEPSRAAQIQRVLAIPGKRHTRTLGSLPESSRNRRLTGGSRADRLGSAAAIMPCCWWPSKQVCAYRN